MTDLSYGWLQNDPIKKTTNLTENMGFEIQRYEHVDFAHEQVARE